jgi:Tol biopolymer transport system component
VTCGLVLAAAGPAQATFPGRNGLIAHGYSFCEATEASIGLTGPSDACGFIPTGAVTGARNISWSPSGKQLAFDAPATSLGTGQALYVVNADGTGLRQVGRGDLLRYNPAWSPDGTKLVFVQDNGAGAGSGDIYTITTNGGSLTRLTTSGGWDGNPDWSADGTRIAYTSDYKGKRHVWQMTPTGASKTVTTANLVFDGPVDQVSWSPDSASIAFTAGGAPNATDSTLERLYRVSRSGSNLRVLAGISGPGYTGLTKELAWSPDGTRVLYGEVITDRRAYWSVNSVNGGDKTAVWGCDPCGGIDAGGWQPLR